MFPLATSVSARAAARAQLRSFPRASRAAHSDAGSGSVYTNETFLNATWLKAFAAVGVFSLAYAYLPRARDVPASSTLDNAALEKEASSDATPWLTRAIARQMAGAADTNTKRNDKHLSLATDVADQRLLFNEAEQPPVRRLAFPSWFEQESPHCVAVGSSIDLKDLVVKQDKE